MQPIEFIDKILTSRAVSFSNAGCKSVQNPSFFEFEHEVIRFDFSAINCSAHLEECWFFFSILFIYLVFELYTPSLDSPHWLEIVEIDYLPNFLSRYGSSFINKSADESRSYDRFPFLGTSVDSPHMMT